LARKRINRALAVFERLVGQAGDASALWRAGDWPGCAKAMSVPALPFEGYSAKIGPAVLKYLGYKTPAAGRGFDNTHVARGGRAGRRRPATPPAPVANPPKSLLLKSLLT